MNPELQAKLTESIYRMVEERNLAVENLTREQLANAIEQAIKAGDFRRFVAPNGGQQVVYLPFQMVDELQRQTNLEREYRQLLADELDEVIAFVPGGWKSSRYDKGVELRRALGIPKDSDPQE
jgi:predicted nucleic acid-binding Zn ribbon protein